MHPPRTADSIPSSRRADRRTRQFRAMLYSFFMRRRRGMRRSDDRGQGFYVDLHEPRLLYVVVATTLLCVADAYLTLTLLRYGGEELNPFMEALIARDVHWFFVIKFAITATGLIFAVLHKHFTFFRVIRGYHLLYSVFIMYVVLIEYEIVLVVANDLPL